MLVYLLLVGIGCPRSYHTVTMQMRINGRTKNHQSLSFFLRDPAQAEASSFQNTFDNWAKFYKYKFTPLEVRVYLPLRLLDDICTALTAQGVPLIIKDYVCCLSTIQPMWLVSPWTRSPTFSSPGTWLFCSSGLPRTTSGTTWPMYTRSIWTQTPATGETVRLDRLSLM